MDSAPIALPAEVVHRLPEWRRIHKSELIFVPKWELVLRPLTRGEVIDFERNAATEALWSQISVFRDCLLYPEWRDFADLISIAEFQSAFDALFRLSGFRDPGSFDNDLEQWRMLAIQRDHAVIRHICKAFPRYTDEDVNAMPRSRILYLLAQSEYMLGVTYDGQNLEELHKHIQAKAQAQAIRQRNEEMQKAGLTPRRTFSVEKDAQTISDNETNVRDMDKKITRSTQDIHGR